MTRTKQWPQWSYAAGERGRNRVRVFTDVRTGRLFAQVREHGRRVTQALGHRDQAQAKVQADEIAARLCQPEPATRHRLTLAQLFDNYVREVTPTKSESRQRHDRRATKWILAVVGQAKVASDLTHRDAARYVSERQRQGDRRRGRDGKVLARTIGTRGIAENVTLWQAVLNWGVNAGWLDRNPLRGFRVKSDGTPKRPSITAEEYEHLLAVADAIPAEGLLQGRPSLFRLALVLAHETGHRISAIRQLRWSDVELDEARVRWRAENDKTGLEHETPLTPSAVEVLREARKARPGIGDGWLFPSPRAKGQPLTREVLSAWWLEGEVQAGLRRVERRGWHSLRRKFATELKHTPLKDLCALGGWKSYQTVLTCYQQADPETMREALAKRARFGE